MPKHDLNPLVKSLIDGNHAEAVSETEKLLVEGISEKEIISDGIEKAMNFLDEKCTVAQFNLLEIMLAGRAVMGVMKLIYPDASEYQNYSGKKVVLATLEGDIHDLGKNILKMILLTNGFQVIDCGKDCSLNKLLEVAEREHPFAIGVSGLITTVIPKVQKIKPLMQERGLSHVKIMGGGAALKQSSVQKLNIDFLAETAFDSLKYFKALELESDEQSGTD